MHKNFFLFFIFVLISCGEYKKKSVNEIPADTSEINNSMLTEKDFNQILKEKGIPPVYVYDSIALEEQMKYSNKINVQDAFAQGLESLFVHTESCVGCDDFYSMITSQPESFGLTASGTKEQIKEVILNELHKDTALKICLLPADIENASPEGIKLFPPENGEMVKDYWIWYVKCSFFPGPAWILMKRDASMPAYHYGYL